MTSDYSYVYKKEAKQWLLSHVGEVLNFVDDLVANTAEPLRARIAALEEEIADNEEDIDYYERRIDLRTYRRTGDTSWEE